MSGWMKRLLLLSASVLLRAFLFCPQIPLFVCTSSFHDSPLSLGVVDSIPQETAVPCVERRYFFIVLQQVLPDRAARNFHARRFFIPDGQKRLQNTCVGALFLAQRAPRGEPFVLCIKKRAVKIVQAEFFNNRRLALIVMNRHEIIYLSLIHI